MKRQRKTLVLIVSLLIISILGLETAAALSTKSYTKSGYTCTTVYNSGKSDAGFAAFRATKKGKVFYSIAIGQGESVNEDLTDSARPAYGWTTFTYRFRATNIKANTTMYFNQAIWDTGEWGCYMNTVTAVKVKGKLKETTGVSLTDYVTDSE
jgi:hypothetical protein